MFKKSLTVIFFIFWVALAIDPADPAIWALENILVVTLFPAVLWLDRRYNFNNWTYLSLTVYVILHLFGAHLTYETMTYFTWFSDWFGWERNHYDHLIHLLFGLLVFVPFFEIFYHQGMSRRLSYLIAFLFITGVGAWYEILEWLAMEIFCEQSIEVCLMAITQGDIWDAQKDIAYSILGSIIALLLHNLWGSKKSTMSSQV
ncbi:MAG: DUF2238 domain-containing protein [Sedimenticola sp.]